MGNSKMNDGHSRALGLAGELRRKAVPQGMAVSQGTECMWSRNGRTCHGISDKGSIWGLGIKKISRGRNYLNWTLARIRKDAGGVCWPPWGVEEGGR